MSFITRGEQKALDAYVDKYGMIERHPEFSFIAGYRAAVEVLEARIAWLDDEISRKPTSYPDTEAQIGHQMERHVVQAILDRLKECGK